MENVPFTKRSLKNLCSKLNREQSDNNAKKTMDIFAELKASDPDFNYNVQVDAESRVTTPNVGFWEKQRPIQVFWGCRYI
jgi:hypothetical protein